MLKARAKPGQSEWLPLDRLANTSVNDSSRGSLASVNLRSLARFPSSIGQLRWKTASSTPSRRSINLRLRGFFSLWMGRDVMAGKRLSSQWVVSPQWAFVNG